MLRRGFKSQCERRAVEIRKTLGLDPTSPLHANDLAAHIGVTVFGANEVENFSKSDLDQITRQDLDAWSALTLRIGPNHLIVYNSGQSDARTNSVIMHELSHIILGHELAAAQISSEGHLIPSNYNQAQEDEADWLGATLLLPRPALLMLRRERIPDKAVMDTYLVSQQMLVWRLRMTGVDYQMNNSRTRKH